MAWVIRKYKRRTVRGKTLEIEVHRTFADPNVFDIPYESDVHRRFVLRELRYWTDRPPSRGRNRGYEFKQAERWRLAILRDAALLKGFFAEEPKWREKMLRWCDKIVAKNRS